MGLGPLNWTSEAGAYQGLQQQAFDNQQTAARTDAYTKSAGLEQQAMALNIQQKQETVQAEKSFDTLYAKNLAAQYDEMQKQAPTKSVHEQETGEIGQISQAIQSQTIQGQAAEQTAMQLAKSGDAAGAALAMKRATEIKSHLLEQSTKLIDLRDKQAEMIARGLMPVIANGGNQDTYNEWIKEQLDRGNNVAAYGLTGDVKKDFDKLQLMQSKGTSVKDQLADQRATVKAAHQQLMDESMIKHRSVIENYMVGKEARDQQKMEDKKQSTGVKTREDEMKAQTAIHKSYEAQRLSLQAKLTSSLHPPTPQGRAIINEQIKALDKNFRQQKVATRETFLPGQGQSALGGKESSTGTPSTADAFLSKYNLN